MKLGETVTYPGLEEYPCVGMSICSPYLPSGFGGRAGSDVSMSHIFPQGVLAAITLVGGGAGYGGAKARASCELGLLLCLVAITFLLGTVRGSQGAGAEALRVASKLVLFHLSVRSPLFQQWHHHHRGEKYWSKKAHSGYPV